MASRPEFPMRHVAPLAAAATAWGWWLGTGLSPLWWMTWIAPLPLLACAVRLRARWAALATFLAFAAGGTNLWHYLHDTLRLPLPVVLLAIATPALLAIPAVLLWRALLRRGRAVAAMFALPLTMTGLWWANAALSPHGTFGHVAYAQMDALAVIQTAAVLGLWGVGFLVWLLPALLTTLTAPGIGTRQRLAASAIGIALLSLALGSGIWRLHGDGAETRLRIGLVSIGGFADVAADIDRSEGRRLLDAYLTEIDRLAERGARMVVAPESALLVRSHAIAPLQALATRRNVRIVIGTEDHSDLPYKRNTALVFEPGKDMPASYVKHHLIPGIEDRYTPGTARTMLPGEPRTGVTICKDLDFTATGHDYGVLDASLVLAPAWDFGEDAWLHGRMAVLRGVENGFALARSARDGHLTLSDDRGRVLAQASSAASNATVTLLGDVPLRTRHTPYTRIGDAFGWLSLLAAGLLAASLLMATLSPRLTLRRAPA